MATGTVEWISVSEAARILVCHRMVVERLIEGKKLTTYRVPGSKRVKLRRSEIERLKEEGLSRPEA